MPPFRKPNLVTLRRQNPNQAWGFRLAGGSEIDQPFHIQKVTPGSLSFLGGLSEGDVLVRIGNISLRGLTHDEVQQIIMRCTHCIDLFVTRQDNSEIQPRFELVLKTPDQPNTALQSNRIQQYEFERQQQLVVEEKTFYDQHQHQSQFNHVPQSEMQTQVLNTLAKPYSAFGESSSLLQAGQPANKQQQKHDHSPSAVNEKPSSPSSGGRKIRIKSPLKLGGASPPPHSFDATDNLSKPLTPTFQSSPATPTVSKEFGFFSNDQNNNKVYGMSARPTAKAIAPLGGHGVQPVENERKYFGIQARERLNNVSFDRHWKEPLPMLNTPNLNQLLPSQTKQMQTYINQTPPTERFLKPSVSRLESRCIRPVWPPPHPGRGVSRAYAENRDSPSSKMFNWPPSRASSVERDFGYGVRSGSPVPDRIALARPASPGPGRRNPHNLVGSTTRQWPPPSNATPAGKSGFMPTEDDDENYAYNSRRSSRESTPIGSHIPRTYRSPPDEAPSQSVIVDF